MRGQKIVCLDFDGVLHSYSSGWQGVDVVADAPVDGALRFLRQLIDDDRVRVAIYSSRSKSEEGRRAMQQWLLEHGLEHQLLAQIEFPTTKPPAYVTLDDRALCFRGTWPVLDELLEFTPWNKGPASQPAPDGSGVTQDLLGSGEAGAPGNCMQAAVATCLGLQLREVPHFILFGPLSFWVMEIWLEQRGLRPVELESLDQAQPGELVYVGGLGPRGLGHAVVYRNGELYWDPHPSRDGLAGGYSELFVFRSSVDVFSHNARLSRLLDGLEIRALPFNLLPRVIDDAARILRRGESASDDDRQLVSVARDALRMARRLVEGATWIQVRSFDEEK